MRRLIAWAVLLTLLLSAAVGLIACRRKGTEGDRTDTNAGSPSETMTNSAAPTTEQSTKEEPTKERPTEEQPTAEPPTTEQPTEPPVPDDWKDPLKPPAEDDGNWTPRL